LAVDQAETPEQLLSTMATAALRELQELETQQ
jgi:hypothetical protein